MTPPELRYDEPKLVEALSNLPLERRALFAASCAQRLLTAYSRMPTGSSPEEPVALQRILSHLWNDLEGTPSEDLGVLETSAEALVPDEDGWDDVGFGEDAAAAVVYAVRTRRTGHAQEAAWASRRVYAALDLHVVTRDDIDFNDPIAEQRVIADPLVQAELTRQQRDLAEAAKPPTSEFSSFARLVRERALSEGLALFSLPAVGS